MASVAMTSLYDSYPPLFRPNRGPSNGVDLDEATATNYSGEDHLPVIDLRSLNHTDGRRSLAEACKDWGIFRVVNHGVPITILNELQDRAKVLFSLSFESKEAEGIFRPMTYFWGTTGLTPAGAPLKIERGPNPLNKHWVEGFNAPMSQLSVQAEDPMIEPFRFLLEEYGRHQSRLAATIFEAMAENLNLDKQQSVSCMSPSTGHIRVYRYPRCTAGQAWGIDSHTDSSVLSILAHDEVGGLQVLKDDQWLDVQPIPDTLVVNLGDIAQAMSDDAYRSVKHRVKTNKYLERISIGCFVFPVEDVLIQSSKYKPFCYADFRAQVQLDLRTIGFKAALQHFKLSR